MTPTTAKRVVIGATAITATSTAVRSLRKGDTPRPRVFLGAAMLGAMLGAGAGFAPTLVVAIAILIALGSLLLDVDSLPSIISTPNTVPNGKVR